MSSGHHPDTAWPEKDALTAALVHELRQPLTGVEAGLSLVAAELGERATGLDSWQLVVSQVQRLREILQTFCDLTARPGDTRMPFELAPVVRRALSLLDYRLRALGPRFSFDAGEGLPLAAGAARAVIHALVNLVANALDALEEAGGGRLEVRLLAPAAPAEPLEVRVSDEGRGFAPGAALFEAGFTTKARGNGLGLDLSRRLMRAWGGDVAVMPAGEARRRSWAGAEVAVLVPVAEVSP